MSRLRYVEGEYLRDDFAVKQWTADDKAETLSFWRSTYIAPPPPEEEALKKEDAESMLRTLMEDSSPENMTSVFILAVSLERKKILVEQDVQIREDGLKIRIYEHKGNGDTFVIPDPGLSLADAAEIQEEVALKLGWIQPAEPEPEPEPEAAEVVEVALGEASDGDAGDQPVLPTAATDTADTAEALDTAEAPDTAEDLDATVIDATTHEELDEPEDADVVYAGDQEEE